MFRSFIWFPAGSMKRKPEEDNSFYLGQHSFRCCCRRHSPSKRFSSANNWSSGQSFDAFIEQLPVLWFMHTGFLSGTFFPFSMYGKLNLRVAIFCSANVRENCSIDLLIMPAPAPCANTRIHSASDGDTAMRLHHQCCLILLCGSDFLVKLVAMWLFI